MTEAEEKKLELIRGFNRVDYGANWQRSDVGFLIATIDSLRERLRLKEQAIDMLLFCPKCGAQHIDAPDERTPDWTNPPHKSHLCHECQHIWRPCDRPTNGVAAIATKGGKDGSPVPSLQKELAEAREDAAKWKGVVRDVPLDQGYCYLYCHDSSHDADCPWLLAQEPEKPETL